MEKQLEDKIAIVTGADSGIGQAIAREFAAQGADVVITYFSDEDGATQTRREVEDAGRRTLVVRCDQRDPDEVAKLFEETTSRLGTPFILVNNAGVDFSGSEVADMTLEEWDNVIKTNLYGPFYCCREFIRARRADGGAGKIINVTSVHQEIPMAGAAGYGSAKGGLRNLTRTLCLELAAEHINVNNIAPGMILTPMNQTAIDDPNARERQEQNIPWKRAGQPEEVAKLALYLASSDSDYATGQTFTLDGGLSLSLGQGA